MQRYDEARAGVIKKLGARCVRCGIEDPRVLCLNHKNGDGAEERRTLGQRRLYIAIMKGKRSTDDLELRCFNCNEIYEYERGRKGIFVKKAEKGEL